MYITYYKWVNRKDGYGNLFNLYYNLLVISISITSYYIQTVFILNPKTSQYAQNSAPIDDTDVMRRVSAVGREFRFTLDTELLPTLTLNT